jgi:colanic acid biosynthesis glycosyl transferase WcaI
MRLLLLGLNFYPELTGIGKYTGEMAAYLAAQGCQVRVITAPPYYPHWRVQPPYHPWQYCRERWQGVRLYRCPLWVPRRESGPKRLLHLSSFAVSSLPAALAQLPWRPQIVITVAPALLSAPVALAAARLSRAKAWLHIQDFEVDAAFNLGLLPPTGRLVRLVHDFERRLLCAFDVVSTISPSMCARLVQKGVPPQRIFHFPNWVDTHAIYPLNGASNPLRAQMGLQSDDIVVLYSGNMGRKQGLEMLVEAARRLQPESRIHFVLCGEGAVRRELEAQADGLSNVRFLPLQPVGTLNLLLNLADIHVLPQRAGAADLVMPSKLTGMFASGKPVIAAAPADTEVGRLISRLGCLTPSEDAQALAAAILRLARDPAERRRLGSLGKAYADQNLSKDIVLTNLFQRLQTLAAP